MSCFFVSVFSLRPRGKKARGEKVFRYFHKSSSSKVCPGVYGSLSLVILAWYLLPVALEAGGVNDLSFSIKKAKNEGLFCFLVA